MLFWVKKHIISSVQFNSSVVSDSLWPHGLQHTRPPCPSLNSQSLLKLMSVESVMSSNHLIFCHVLLLLTPILPSFTFIKRLLSSSSLSAIRVVLSAYLGLLIFLPAILIPACASSSPEFLIMYSAYKLNKQGDNIQPWHTPFPIWNQDVVPCPVLTVASWPAYRFLKRQVRWSGIPISFRIFHSLLWSTQTKALVYSINQK